MNRITKSETLVIVVLLFALMLNGCYWTPEGDEGGVTLNIDSGEIGASAITDYKFFLGYVIAADLLSGDQAAADQAFEELGVAFEEALSETFSDPDLTEQDLANFDLKLTFPTIQLQADYFVGTSGSNTFGGLRAGREYLVVAFAFDTSTSSATYVGDVGFAPVTIEGGETKAVTLELGNNWGRFYDLMEQRYGYSVEQAAVEITMPATWTGPLYVDLIDGSTADPALPGGTVFFDTWYPSITVLNRKGDEIDTTGTRPQIPDGASLFRIEGVRPNRAWRILITTWGNRASTTPSGDMYMSATFTTTEGSEEVLDFSTLGSADDFTQYFASY